MERPTEDVRVKATSNPKLVATAIIKSVQSGKTPLVRSIGAGSLNQAIKAATIARGECAKRGHNLVIVPAFKDVQGNHGETVTAIELSIEER